MGPFWFLERPWIWTKKLTPIFWILNFLGFYLVLCVYVSNQLPHFRSSSPEVFWKKGVLRPATFLKKRLWHRCFPVNFAKFQRTPSLQNTSGRLLLYREYTCTISFPKFSTKDSMLFNQKNILWHFMVIAGMFLLSHWFVSYGSAVFCKGN